MVIFMIKYFIIQRMKKKGASHLPAPLVGCSCLDDGPIPTAPPKTSMVTNQYICIFESHSSPHLLAFKSFMPRRLIIEIGRENWFAAGCPIRQ